MVEILNNIVQYLRPLARTLSHTRAVMHPARVRTYARTHARVERRAARRGRHDLCEYFQINPAQRRGVARPGRDCEYLMFARTKNLRISRSAARAEPKIATARHARDDRDYGDELLAGSAGMANAYQLAPLPGKRAINGEGRGKGDASAAFVFSDDDRGERRFVPRFVPRKFLASQREVRTRARSAK